MDIDQNELVRMQQKAVATLHMIEDRHQFFHRTPDGQESDYTSDLKGYLTKIIDLTSRLSAQSDGLSA